MKEAKLQGLETRLASQTVENKKLRLALTKCLKKIDRYEKDTIQSADSTVKRLEELKQQQAEGIMLLAGCKPK